MSYRMQWALPIAFVLQSHAQTGDGFLVGKVLNSDHQPQPSVKVCVQKDGKSVAEVTTDNNGTFRFTLPNGNYQLRAGNNETKQSVEIVSAKTSSLDLVLSPTAEQLKFFDEPQFTVAGVTDNTYRGGHGSDDVLRSSENLTKAIASLTTMDNAGAAEPHHVLAEREELSGHPLEAAQEFQIAADLNPSERNLFDWGTELLSHRAPRAAQEVFTRGSRLYPRSVRMLLGLATAQYTGGSFEQAAQSFFSASDLNPNDPVPYDFLNRVKDPVIKNSAGYCQRFMRFAKLKPENALANYYYAECLWQQRTGPADIEAYNRALSLLTKAISLDPHLDSAYLALGIIHADQRNYAKAATAYQMAIKENPKLEEAHYRLSEAYRVLGDRKEADIELAAFRKLSEQSASKLERERKEVQQFVIALKNTAQ